MASAIEKAFVFIELLEFVTGIWGNGFILLATCADWVKTKKISLFDFICMCLAISRIGVICIILTDSLQTVFCLEVYETHHMIIIIVDLLWNLLHSLSFWCATCLSVFYFLKLSNFSHPFFLWLKWRRDKVVFTILLGFFLSFFLNLLSVKFDIFVYSDYLKMKRNLTWKEYLRNSQYVSNKILLNLGFLIPMAVSLVSFFLLIFSLWRHTRQMLRHAEGPGDLSTAVHARARNTMISFLIFLVVHYLATLFIILSYNILENSLSVIISETVALLYPSIHPINTILRNRKLRQTSANLLRKTESCIKGLESLTARRS